MAKKTKTNVMRVLEQKKIPYNVYEYDNSDNMIDGVTVAEMIGCDPNLVYKTLVSISKSKQYYVFVLPVNKELSLKKAAKSVGEKKIELIPVKQIEQVTGYIKGGCSPIGMKKAYKTTFDESALTHKKIIFNAGKVGHQVEVNPHDITKVIRADFADICE